MGKPTGFLEYARKTNESLSAKSRIKNYGEFHPAICAKEREAQGARCMNCGVPFCQSAMKIGGSVSGCPLHNLIPEFNDEIYHKNWAEALARLLKTNDFPEFTGRVCPALCEAACTCGIYDGAVTVRENELAIIEYGYGAGIMTPQIPPVRTEKKVAVIGSGPAGLAAATRLNRRGHRVTVYERDDRIGGLLMYGIPNMKLDKKVIDRRIDLMEQEGITFVTETDIGKDISAEYILSAFDAVVLSCGAKQPRDIRAQGRDTGGIHFAVDFLKATTRSLLDSNMNDGDFISARGKNVVVIGGGDTGNDCVATAIRHGCASVVQIEMMPRLPDERGENNPWPQWPKVCKTDYGQEEAIAVFGSDPRIYQSVVKEFVADENGELTAVTIVGVAMVRDEATGKMNIEEIPDSEKTLHAELALIAAGFVGCESYTAQAFGVNLNERNNVHTAEDSYATNVDKVFVAGDMHRGQSLVVWAIAEGRACAKAVDKYLVGYTNME